MSGHAYWESLVSLMVIAIPSIGYYWLLVTYIANEKTLDMITIVVPSKTNPSQSEHSIRTGLAPFSASR